MIPLLLDRVGVRITELPYPPMIPLPELYFITTTTISVIEAEILTTKIDIRPILKDKTTINIRNITDTTTSIVLYKTVKEEEVKE